MQHETPSPQWSSDRASPQRPSRVRFRRATGYVAIDYVHTVRIEEAKQILETTEASIEGIGAEVGLRRSASFRRLFKRKSGLTPAEYRRLFGRRRFRRYSLKR